MERSTKKYQVCRPFCLTAALTFAAPALADETAADDNTIVVKGQLVSANAAAWSTTTLKTQDIRDEAPGDFDDLLRAVPGVTVRDFGLGGVASSIVIRGFGNGGHGGDLGAVIDGIPLNEAMSHADGYVDLNVIIPLEVADVTVYRGPVSALYGNYNRGGLIRIDTRKGGEYLNADVSLGSNATADMQVAAGHEWHGGRFNIAGQSYITDGYRPQSDQERQTIAGRVGFDLSPSVNLALSGRYHRADAMSASYLTRTQFDSDAYGIDPNVQNDGAKKEFATLRVDANVALSSRISVNTFAYTTRQDFTRWFTRSVSAVTWRQREEAFDRTILGAGTSLNGSFDADWAYAPFAFALGAEMFRERTDFMFFDGLENRRPTAPAANDRTTRLNSLSAFAEIQAPFHKLFDLSLGLRADRFTGGCRLNGPETGSDPCGDLNTIERLSPKLGARSQVMPWLQLRVSWAEGFALPNNFIKYALGGQALDANVFRQTELGLKLSPTAALTFDSAVFHISSTQEVRSVVPGIYENFGATRRRGFETSFEWDAAPFFRLRSVYSYTKTEIRQNADASLIGKAVAGVPRHSANIDATVMPIANWALSVNWRYVSSYKVNAANTARSKDYDTFDLSLSYDGKAPFAYRAFLRIDNLTDAKYATSVSIIGGQRVLAPGAPRTVRASLQISL